MEVNDEDLYLTLHSVLGYAMGRSSYIVGWAIEFAQKAFPELEEVRKAAIIGTVRDLMAIARKDQKMPLDQFQHRDWKSLLDWMVHLELPAQKFGDRFEGI